MTCKDCVHYEVCYLIEHYGADIEGVEDCTKFKPKSSFVELPCEVGQTVYRVRRFKCDVDGYGMRWYEDWGIETNSFHLGMLYEIGKTVFLSKEEAENALKEREKE